MNAPLRSLLFLCGGSLLVLVASACTKEFSCPLGPGQGVCASISQVYTNDPKAQPKAPPCDPFTEDCSKTNNKQVLSSLTQGQRNQYPILSDCNPYTQPCLAGQSASPVATGAPTRPTAPLPSPTLPPGIPNRTLFTPMPQPGSAPVLPPILGSAAPMTPPAALSGPQATLPGTVRIGEAPFQAPVRIGERILRMWVPDWQDVDGDLHAASFHYVQVAPSSWWPVETPPAQSLRSDHNAYPTPPRRLTNDQRQQLQTGSQTVVTTPNSILPNPFVPGTTPMIAPPNQSGGMFNTR